MRWLALAAVAPLIALNAACQHEGVPSHTQTITLDAQGSSPEWDQSPHWREFYTLSVEMLGANASVDVAEYEQKSFAIFRAFAGSIHANPEGMIDHLKNIPREMVGIVKQDPQVLDSYENFLVALRGPR
jgi:hypothetical protein